MWYTRGVAASDGRGLSLNSFEMEDFFTFFLFSFFSSVLSLSEYPQMELDNDLGSWGMHMTGSRTTMITTLPVVCNATTIGIFLNTLLTRYDFSCAF